MRSSRSMAMSRRDPLYVVRESRDRSLAYLKKERDERSGARKLLGMVPPAENPAIMLLEAGVGALLTGWIAGRFGTTGIASTGIPLGLAVGGAGLVASYLKLLPTGLNEHVQNVSVGAVTAYLAFWGAGQGGQSRAASGAQQGAIVAGVPAMQAPPMQQFAAPSAPFMGARVPQPQQRRVAPLSEAEIQAISRRMGMAA